MRTIESLRAEASRLRLEAREHSDEGCRLRAAGADSFAEDSKSTVCSELAALREREAAALEAEERKLAEEGRAIAAGGPEARAVLLGRAAEARRAAAHERQLIEAATARLAEADAAAERWERLAGEAASLTPRTAPAR